MEILLNLLRTIAGTIGYYLIPSGDFKNMPPTVNRITIEIILKSGQYNYKLNQYEQLNGRSGWLVLVKRIFVPYATTYNEVIANSNGTVISKSPTGKDIASLDVYTCGYLNLKNRSSDLLRNAEPLIDYMLDQNYKPGVLDFNELTVDFTTSNVTFADETAVDANDGKSVLIVVEWQDVLWEKK